MQRKKERKRARDMDRDHTFDLPDLTEDFWKTVVFAQEDPPSGMGGPGCVCLLSKEGKEYIFGFEETPFYKSPELFPIFETTDERIGYRHKYKAEDHGWKYLEKENALIREDILDAYSKAAAEAKREKENFWHFYAIDLAGRAIGVEHLERYDYIGSVLYRERMEREMAERRHCETRLLLFYRRISCFQVLLKKTCAGVIKMPLQRKWPMPASWLRQMNLFSVSRISTSPTLNRAVLMFQVARSRDFVLQEHFLKSQRS